MSVERKLCFLQPEKALKIFKYHIVTLPRRYPQLYLSSLMLLARLFLSQHDMSYLLLNPSELRPGSTAPGAARPWITTRESPGLVSAGTASASCALMPSIFMPKRHQLILILRGPTTGAVHPPATNLPSPWGHRRVPH